MTLPRHGRRRPAPKQDRRWQRPAPAPASVCPDLITEAPGLVPRQVFIRASGAGGRFGAVSFVSLPARSTRRWTRDVGRAGSVGEGAFGGITWRGDRGGIDVSLRVGS